MSMFLTLIFVLFVTGCNSPDEIASSKVPLKGGVKGWLYPYSFNWEDPNLNWMPYPANRPQISVPWTGQGSLYSVVDADVLNDRKKSDGWELVYSTFDPNLNVDNPYFMLYNKYRGIMRIFIYINNGVTSSPSTYLQNGITLANNQFSVLNFAGKDIIDPAEGNKTRFDKVEPAPPDGSAPLALNKWYLLQYEWAYDPQILPTVSANPPQFSIYGKAINITKVDLGGTQVGTLKGTIGGTGSSDFFSTLTPVVTNIGTGVLAAAGIGYIDKHTTPGTTDGSNDLGLNKNIFKALGGGVNSALSTATSNLPGAVYNVLSAIFGGSSASTQTVSLNLSTQINLAGTNVSTTGLPSLPASYYIPGSLASYTDGNGATNYYVQGYVPLYNKPLGVFKMANRPTVNARVTKWSVTNPSDPGVPYSKIDNLLEIDQSTVNLQFNPALLSVATVTNIKTEVIARHPGNADYTNGRTEYTGYSRLNTVSFGYNMLERAQPYYSALVRVSFLVTPISGGPPSAIVKTFEANLNTTTYIVPPSGGGGGGGPK